MNAEARTQKITKHLLSALMFAVLFALLLGANMQKSLDHDEHQFIAGGALLAQKGLLPYKDYAYFHMPYLAFAYAAIFKITAYRLLAARVFSTACAWLMLIAILLLAWRLFRGRHLLLRSLLSLGSAGLILTNPLFVYTSGKAWNHDATVLLILLAFLASGRSVKQNGCPKWLFLSGLLLGLATGVRLSAAPLALPFLLMTLWPAPKPRSGTLRRPMTFGLGLLVGLLPAAFLFVLAPRQFLFGNLGYPHYNTLYRQQVGFVAGDVSVIAMSIGGKLRYLARYVFSSPGNLLLLLAFVFFALYMPLTDLHRPGPYRFELTLSLLLIPFLLIGSFAPTPAFFQYFYALVPFALLSILYAMADLRERKAKQNWSLALWVLILTLSCAYGIKAYESIHTLFTPDDWLPMQVHRSGREIAEMVGAEPVLTLSPIFPLEGQVDIYPEFATGVFAWRVAPLVPYDTRREMGIISPTELTDLLASKPPGGILVGDEGGLEQPFVDYAEQNGYEARPLDDGHTLWVAPLQR